MGPSVSNGWRRAGAVEMLGTALLVLATDAVSLGAAFLPFPADEGAGLSNP